MLEAVPDLQDRLRRGDPRLLAGIYEDFKVTATYEKATRQLTVDAALVTDAEAKRPPGGRPSLTFDIAGAGSEHHPATGYRFVEVRELS